MYELTDLTVVQRHMRVMNGQHVADNGDLDFPNNLRNNDDSYKKSGYNGDFYAIGLCKEPLPKILGIRYPGPNKKRPTSSRGTYQRQLDHYIPNESPNALMNVENAPVHVKKPWAYAADVAWNGMVAFAIILMFYAAKWNRPYLITPKLIFDAIAAGIMTVSAVTVLILTSGTAYSGSRNYEHAAYAIFAATISCYIFAVTLKYFKYLLHKRAFLDGTLNGVFVLPFATHGVRMTDAEIWNHMELSAYGAATHSDVPPAYPGVAIPKDDATPADSTSSVVPVGMTGNTLNDADVNNQLPTYDQAQKLRENNQKKELM
uniref:MARVEL domain-containing protein n=1 Tax=Romanomermis culicivorax TaxID=13658 RepID=A0A915ICT6_ROMCU